MSEKITEDMRIDAEVKSLDYAGLIDYILQRQKEISDVVSEPKVTMEQIRSRARLPRKRALAAAKHFFEDRPEDYAAFLKHLNSLTPRYLTNKEYDDMGISRHPDRSPVFVRKYEKKCRFFLRRHNER